MCYNLTCAKLLESPLIREKNNYWRLKKVEKLTIESVQKLNPGDVVRIGDTMPVVAVVNTIDREIIDSKPGLVAIQFRCQDGSYFGFGGLGIDGSYSFELLDEHEPVADYGLNGWDFVSNHRDQLDNQ